MNKICNFLIKLSKILFDTAYFLKDFRYHNEYYVFVPSKEKPKFVHSSFKNAEQEALRLKAKFEKESNYSMLEDRIEILQIVKEYAPPIPF